MTRRTAFSAIVAVGVVLFPVACTDSPTTFERVDLAKVGSSSSSEEMALLGEFIFDDVTLSIRKNQACASCHAEAWGATGPDPAINAAGAVYEGSIPGRFGNRKPPTSAYATPSPVLGFEPPGLWVGGNFWDGRATGDRLGNPAADQAQGPFLNPVEQALPDAACVVYRVSTSAYAELYGEVWGPQIFTIEFPANTDELCGQENVTVPLSETDRTRMYEEYDRIALVIAEYEASPDVNAFSSKFDAWRRGEARLTKQEHLGFALFQGKGKCARCHVSHGKSAAFTDFSYDNLGVPKNPLNPVYTYDPGFVDEGLGGFLKASGQPMDVWMPELGKMKVPTLRNVDARPFEGATKAYTHNGFFTSLKDVVHFYNTRDVLPRCEETTVPEVGVNCWPTPEVEVNVNDSELGDLGLTEEQEWAIVAFLKTLSDGFAR